MRLLKNIAIKNRYGIILIISVLFLFLIWVTMLINGTESTQIICLTDGRRYVSTWLDYKDHWKENVLLYTNLTARQIAFTEEYQLEMIAKGPHPLNIEYNRYLKRVERLDQYCSAFESNSQGKFDVTLVNNRVMFIDKAKLLICSIPKASSSTWLNMMMNLEEDTNLKTRTMVSRDDPIWERISLTQNLENSTLVAERFQTYTKFFIARNPFMRLLSAYTSKFTNKQYPYENKYAPKIIKANYLSHLKPDLIEKVRTYLKGGMHTISKLELEDSIIQQLKRLDAGEGNYNITFIEFLNYLIADIAESGRDSLDHHWAPVTIVCNPCTVRYDFIVKFETLQEDSEVLLDYVQAHYSHNNTVQFPRRSPQIDSNRCNEAFKEIPVEVKEKIYQLYKEDFIFFDYQYNGDDLTGDMC